MDINDFIGSPRERLAQELRREQEMMDEIKLDTERKAGQAPQEVELDDETDLEAALADLAADLTSHYMSFNPEDLNSCTLLGPEQLTVEVEGRGYRKMAHMGGEDFTPLSAYVGKKRKIIVVFKPVHADAYSTMEMTADEAVTNLSGFEALSVTNEGDYRTRMRLIASKATKLKEREAVKDKSSDYDNFGSF
jgi:hypothetical protein